VFGQEKVDQGNQQVRLFGHLRLDGLVEQIPAVEEVARLGN